MISIFRKYLSSVILFLISFAPAGVTLAASLPAGNPITLGSIASIINILADFLIIMSVVIAVIFIVWSGVTYMYAGADPGAVKKAQDRLKSGIIGALIVLGVGVIINTLYGVVTGTFFCRFSIGGICIFP